MPAAWNVHDKRQTPDTNCSITDQLLAYRFELQEGLNDFMNWADQWQLRVAEHECLVLSHGNCDPPSYYLKDVNLDNVDHHNDLGVTRFLHL